MRATTVVLVSRETRFFSVCAVDDVRCSTSEGIPALPPALQLEPGAPRRALSRSCDKKD